jgi:pyruvate/2-oxoglutarate dehydrogenase complex dihydrolipoamide dehydrogenase (E3) component
LIDLFIKSGVGVGDISVEVVISASGRKAKTDNIATETSEVDVADLS